MLPKVKLLAQLVESGVVAVIRKVPEDKIESLVSSLINGGINALEITVDSPNGFTIIKNLTSKFNHQAIIGAGTVLDSSSAKLAINNGADFIVSPCLNIEVMRTTLRYGKISIPGIMTPTEALTAIENGADIVKVFPADSVGPGFIKNLKGPLSQIPIMTTGGIDLNNVSNYIKEGAVAVGIGGNLINKQLISNGDFQEIEEIARKYVNVVAQARGGK